MCGRFTLTSVDGLIEEFGLTQAPLDWAPRFNIAPSDQVAVIDNRPADRRVLSMMHWGLVPYWAKDPAIGHTLINARCETLAEKPAFRDALRRRRCLVVADGFYEWKREGKAKIPFYVRRASRQPMAMAGLWERWRGPDGHVLLSCTIVTTVSNSLLASIHDRMPVLIAPRNHDRWLEPAPQHPQVFIDMLGAPPAEGLEMYEVSRIVSSPRNDVPACIEPVEQQSELFRGAT